MTVAIAAPATLNGITTINNRSSKILITDAIISAVNGVLESPRLLSTADAPLYATLPPVNRSNILIYVTE